MADEKDPLLKLLRLLGEAGRLPGQRDARGLVTLESEQIAELLDEAFGRQAGSSGSTTVSSEPSDGTRAEYGSPDDGSPRMGGGR